LIKREANVKYWWARLAAAAAVMTCAQTAQADVIFSDNFNSYAYQLNWVPPANWTVTSGSVDLIGQTTPFDFYPGNGRYVDLDGSTGAAGTLRTIMSFAPGTYAVSFDLGGNARNDGPKTTVISLGNVSTDITLASNAALALYSITFTTTGGALSFADLSGGNGNIGNILDNVSVSSVAAVPGPTVGAGTSSFALATLLLGWLVRRRRRQLL
jgi:uncharacterized protein (TIGR03382 family)